MLTYQKLVDLSKQFGPAFYLLDSDVFEHNYRQLTQAFKAYYPKFNIAYSYKTNYTPALVKRVNQWGGYAEVVSEMELEIARRCGVPDKRIIWNGPVKNKAYVTDFVLKGGTVNLDCVIEADFIRALAVKHPFHMLCIGIRCNYEVGDEVISRFGVDVNRPDFNYILTRMAQTPNIRLTNLQVHFAKRDPQYWTARTRGLLRVYDQLTQQYKLFPERLDLGGGMYGPMPENLRTQLGLKSITFDDYAKRSALLLAQHFQNNSHAPELLVEPGSALAGNCMRFVCRVETIKTIQGKTFATVMGSQKNISMNGLNPPMQIFSNNSSSTHYTKADIVGFTCIEGDVLQKDYQGPLAVGDFAVFGNCGSYSLVMKPPFILPNFPVIDITGAEVKIIKRAESFDDLFRTFSF